MHATFSAERETMPRAVVAGPRLGGSAARTGLRAGRAGRDAAVAVLREGGTLARIAGRALLGALRRDPAGALRRAVPLALAVAIVAAATGQAERHAAPWFGDDATVAARAPAPDGARERVAPARRVERADPVVFGLQAELADRGFYGGAIDGIAGSRTRAAIRAWEASEGLPETGTADQAMLARIRAGGSDLAGPGQTAGTTPRSPRPVPVPRGAPTDPVATGSLASGPSGASPGENGDGEGEEDETGLALQRGLVAWGADIAVDGVVGPQTERAVAEYRGANGLSEAASDAAVIAHMRASGLLP